MKNIFLLITIFLLMSFYTYAQNEKITVKSYNGMTLEKKETGSPELLRKQINKLYRNFNEEIVETGILIDKHTFSQQITGYSVDSIALLNKHAWMDVYHGIYKSYINAPEIPGVFLTDSLLRLYKKDRTVPISILAFKYNKIKESAIKNKLIEIENEEFVFTTSKYEQILDTKEIFLASSWQADIYNGSNVVFYLDEDFFFTNISKPVNKIEIDFDDGLGFRNVSFNSRIYVNYAFEGEKIIKVKISYKDNTEYESYFNQNVKTVKTTPTPNSIWQLVADIPYNGQYALGEAYLWLSGNLDKPVLVIEGFDKDENMDQDELYAALNQQNLLETLRSWGYDLVVLNFNYSKDYIQKNAFLVSKLIHRVNTEKVGNEQLVLIGASMGGLVSRYALTYMEHNSITHNVRNFISLDSPQKGANIPLGDQYWLYFFAYADDNPNAQDNLNKINSSAAKQMLNYHHTSFPVVPHSLKENLMTEISNLGNYPSNLKKVAFANGNGSGTGLQLTDGSRLVYWRYRDTWTVDIDGHTWAVPNGSSRKIFDGMIDRVWPLPNDGLEISVGGTSSYDNSPGGKRSTNQTIVNNIPNKYTPRKYTSNPDHAFIPLISALDINTTDLFYNAAGDPNILDKTPFEQVYYAQSNEDHIHISFDTKINLLNEITDFNIPALSVSISGPSVLYGTPYDPDKLNENKDDIVIKAPPNSATGTWTANATGGIGEYSYQWYWEGGGPDVWYIISSATNKEYTRTIYGDIKLKCVVTSGNATAYAIKDVDFIYGDPFPAKNAALNNTKAITIENIPKKLTLIGNYPNPFNPSTTIKLGLPEGQNVKLVVYNVLGEKVITLTSGYLNEGYHEVQWNGKDMRGNTVATGVYIYSLQVGNKRLAKKMFFAK